jgi:hypothetical protein
MKNKLLIITGMLAPIIYVGTVILGGLIRPGYSHIAQPVSDLMATGAPNKALLDLLFALYNLLVLIFGVSLFQWVRAENQTTRKTIGTIGAVVLLLEGLFGFITLFFPEDVGAISEATSIGKLHIVFAGLSALTSMFAILLMGFWFTSIPNLRRYGLYSFISVIVVFVFGGLAATSVANHSPIGGLLERITIGGFIQWIFVVALMMYRSTKSYSLQMMKPSHSS